MMLRWISLVPPMIELARDVQQPERPPSAVDGVVVVGHRAARRARAPRSRSRRAAGSCPPRTASRCSTRRRSPRRARGARACARCAGGRSRRRSTTARAAAARAGRRAGRGAAHASVELVHRQLVQHLLLPHERRAALVGERRVRDPPALVLGADEVLDRHLDVVEEDLVELALAGDLAQRADLDARRRPSGSRASRCPGALRRVRVGAHQRDGPVRRTSRTTTTPSGRSRRTTPPRFSARVVRPARSLPASGSLNSWHQTSSPREDPRHPPPALLLGAVRHQRRPDEADAAAPEQRRRAGAGELLVVDRDLRRRRAAPAVLDRPVDADPAVRRGACAATRAAPRLPRASSRCRPRAAGARPATRAARRGTARRLSDTAPRSSRAWSLHHCRHGRPPVTGVNSRCSCSRPRSM